MQIKGEEVVTPSATPAGQRAGALAGTSLVRRAQHWKGKISRADRYHAKDLGYGILVVVACGRSEKRGGLVNGGVPALARCDAKRRQAAGACQLKQKGTPFVQFWGPPRLYKRPVSANTRRMMRTIPPIPIPP